MKENQRVLYSSDIVNMNYTDLTAAYSDDKCFSQNIDITNNYVSGSSSNALQDIDPDRTSVLNNRSLQCK